MSANLVLGAGGAAAEAHTIDNSCRFNDGDTPYLSRTPGSAGNRRTWTFSCWTKITSNGTTFLAASVSGTGMQFRVTGDDVFQFWLGGVNVDVQTTPVYRDPSAWYHVVLAVDTTQATDTNRVKFYVNGNQVTDFGATVWPAQDREMSIGNTVPQYIGAYGTGHSEPFDGYLAEVYMIDGLQLTSSSFGETDSDTNQWIPKNASGLTFGTNGFYLKFGSAGGVATDNHPGTANGNVHTDTTVKKFGTASAQFDGTGDYLTFSDSDDFNFWNADFTLEAWVRFNNVTANQALLYQGAGIPTELNVTFEFADDDGPSMYQRNTSSPVGFDQGSNTGWSADTWYHFALVRNGSSYVMYRDGASIATLTDATTIMGNASPGPVIGAMYQFGGYNASQFDGYIDEYRLSNVARYTSAFTAPVAAFTTDENTLWLLHMNGSDDGTSFPDASASATSTAWADSSGNDNDFTGTNLTVSDVMVDTPTNNWCTLNPLDFVGTGGSTPSEGNLEIVGGSYPSMIFSSTIAPESGKWYAEFWQADRTYTMQGVADVDIWKSLHNTGGIRGSGAITWDSNTPRYFINSTSQTTASAGGGVGTIMQVAFDADTRKVWFGVDNTWNDSGNPSAGTNEVGAVAGTGPLIFFLRPETDTQIANFGQDSSFAGNKTAQGNQDANEVGDFYYAPPTDFLALCASNISEPAIVLPEPYFEMLTATGDGTSSKTWSGLEFQPDFVWAKDYDGTAQDADHQWMDVLRGADQILRPNTNSQSYDGSTSFGGGSLRTFTSDGFTVEEGTTNNSNLNTSGDSIIAYNWKAGGTGVANTDGSISSTVSANTTSGFALVTFTSNQTAGATVGHGLTQAPEMIFSKRTDAEQSWYSGATSMADTTPWGWAWEINHHNAWSNRDQEWDDTTPSASVFTLGQYGSNSGANPVIAYCFHGVEGYSKIGHYIGNGNVDGEFIYLGFRPSYVILKGNGANLHNHMLDNKRWTYNPVGVTTGPEPGLAIDDAEVPSGEGSGYIDFLSNGFKIRTDNGNSNDNTTRFIYIAFAESPFKYANAR